MMFRKANSFKVISNLTINKSSPVSIVHFLTNRCNARCSFCFIDFDDPKTFKGELTLEEINSLTKNMHDTLLNVNFTGGEPFARKDILEIAKCYIDNTTIQSIYITTNGSLPERALNFVKKINEYNADIELNLQISIDALSEQHDKIRKIKGLFDKAVETYKLINSLNIANINSSVNITVTHENYENVDQIYDELKNTHGVKNLKCILVRDEGIYQTPDKLKKDLLDSYNNLVLKINSDQNNKENKNFNKNSIQGKIHRAKDRISYKVIKEMYLENSYLSPCHASSLFGVIGASGDVFPCEILEDKKIGNLRDYNMNFKELWKDDLNKKTKKWILESKCRCTYECALSFNIIGNYRYYPRLFLEFLK